MLRIQHSSAKRSPSPDLPSRFFGEQEVTPQQKRAGSTIQEREIFAHKMLQTLLSPKAKSLQGPGDINTFNFLHTRGDGSA